nr:MAG TPA: hypothetical protein [Caudoviricetes sp.]DAX94330.1 MAG TPA: hypothetical protein [Bacteriophage sp.]
MIFSASICEVFYGHIRVIPDTTKIHRSALLNKYLLASLLRGCC